MRRIPTAVVVGLIALSATACGSGNSPSPGVGPDPSQDRIEACLDAAVETWSTGRTVPSGEVVGYLEMDTESGRETQIAFTWVDGVNMDKDPVTEKNPTVCVATEDGAPAVLKESESKDTAVYGSAKSGSIAPEAEEWNASDRRAEWVTEHWGDTDPESIPTSTPTTAKQY